MKIGYLPGVLAGIALLGLLGYGTYKLGMDRGRELAASPVAAPASTAAAGPATQTDPATGRRVLYWHDPMVPGQKFDKPGKSPFMDMQLVPVYADQGGDEAGVAVNSGMQQSLGIRTAEVVAGSMSTRIDAVGSVAYDERDIVVVQARGSGFVEKLYVRSPLDAVRKGQPLADLFVPEWVAAQEEYLSAHRLQGSRLESLIDGARQRMRLAGMTERQIQLVESSGQVHARLTIDAPVDGVVSELAAREGMAVPAGAALFRINGLSRVWVNADVAENPASRIRPGDKVQVRIHALPDSVFGGRVGAILPEVDVATRTVKVRIELPNPGRRLAPGMSATIQLSSSPRADVVLVPTEAIIRTGNRSVVILAQEGGRFAPVDVETGAEGAGRTEVRKGLAVGQKVVVSGQFLIDSESNLRGTTSRMRDAPGEGMPTTAHRGRGRVESIKASEIVLSHDPIPSLQWGAMTMAFRLPANVAAKDVVPGDVLTFEFTKGDGGSFDILSIVKESTATGDHDHVHGAHK